MRTMLAVVASPPALSMASTFSLFDQDILSVTATGIGIVRTARSVTALTAVSATNTARWLKQSAGKSGSQKPAMGRQMSVFITRTGAYHSLLVGSENPRNDEK
ncbi:hypothetical protein CBS470a_004367 [Colletotrichum nupharicola]|nr:hypothetical protein CBS470a_004367 [Colletotrichum nupharicola]